MAAPKSSAAYATQLPNIPSSAATIAGELSRQARHDLSKTVVPWLRKPQGRRPPCLAYRAPVGIGKTSALIDVVVDALGSGLRVGIRAPTQALAGEILSRLEKVAPGAGFVWRGREQEDPAAPGHQMCRRADAIRAAQSVGGEPRDVCGSARRGFCVHNPNGSAEDPCGYLQQELGRAHVVIFTGDEMLKLAPRKGMKRAKTWRPYKFPGSGTPSLFDRTTDCDGCPVGKSLPPSSSATDEDAPPFDLLLLDETDPLGMLKGFNSPPARFDLASTLPIIDALRCPQDREILTGFVLNMVEACATHGTAGHLPPMRPGSHYYDIELDENGGWLSFEDAPLRQSELGTADFITILDTVREIAFDNLPKPKGLSQFHALDAAQITDINADVVGLRSFLRAIAKLCKIMVVGLRNNIPSMPHIKVATDAHAVHIRYREDLSHHYDSTPKMIFDATMRPELLEHTFQGLELVYDRHAVDGHGVTRYQLTDSDLSYSTLNGAHWPARLELFARMCCRMLGPTGLIAPKPIRARLPNTALPCLSVAHFGALRGLNSMENVAALIVAGRQAIMPSDAEELAGVLSGQYNQHMQDKESWYPKRMGFIKWREDENAGWRVRHAYHPDSTTEAVRAAITEDSLEQALGRGRNVRRTSARPLTEYVLTSTPTNRPADGTFTLAQLKAATSWVAAFLEMGFWVTSGEKGLGAVLHALVRSDEAQRPDPLYNPLIGVPAFERPADAADWRKKQLNDNPEISALAREIDKALGARAESVEILHTPYPLHDFAPVEAKVRGSRYFAQIYVRTGEGQTAVEALTALLGPVAGELEIRSASGA